jgi:hypothetical protein
VPTFPTLQQYLPFLTYIAVQNSFIQLFVWRLIHNTDTNEIKRIISKIAIIGVATPSRRHIPENILGHIKGQENVKALTIMSVRCQPELMS